MEVNKLSKSMRKHALFQGHWVGPRGAGSRKYLYCLQLCAVHNINKTILITPTLDAEMIVSLKND